MRANSSAFIPSGHLARSKSISLVCLLMLGAVAGMAQTLTCTFQFAATGQLGSEGPVFNNAAITITTFSNAVNPHSIYSGGPIVVDNTAASVTIAGLGTFPFTGPTEVYETPISNLPGSPTVVYLSFGTSNDPYIVTYVSTSAVTLWDMVSSIGPTTSPIGKIEGWVSPSLSPIQTPVGSLGILSANPTSVTFQATYVGNPPPPTPPRIGVLSHIAAGGGWTTVITLVNNSLSSVPVTVSLYNDHGSALSLPVTITQQGASQTTTTSSVTATINAKGSLFISAGDGIPATSVGWADVDSAVALGGCAIFRQTPQIGSPSEGTVPLQTQFPSTITLPYDDSTGFAMGVALANLSTASANVTATVWDDSGNQLGTQSLTIAGNGHMSFVLPTQIPLTVGKRGIVQFQSSGGLAGLGLRFSPFGTFTSVPTI